jgi:hypothetical protein
MGQAWAGAGAGFNTVLFIMSRTPKETTMTSK